MSIDRKNQQPRLIYILLTLCLIISVVWPGIHESAAQSEKFEFTDTGDNRKTLNQISKYYAEIKAKHSRFADVNGIRLHYLEFGDDDGIPLIWSHGYTSTGFEMLSVAAELVDAGYHIFALSNRGHGQTQIDDYNFSLYTIADDIAALMDHLKLDTAVIGGWSLGGGVSTAFYDSYPNRVIGLVLVDGGAMWPFITTVQNAKFLKNLPVESATEIEMPTIFDNEFTGFAAISALHMVSVPRHLDLKLGAMFYSQLHKTSSDIWEFHIDHKRLLGSWKVIDDPMATDKLTLLAKSHRSMLPEVIYRRVKIPMLIIDPTGDDEHSRARSPYYALLAKQHPEWIRHIKYPDTPHMAVQSRPEWFISDMKKFKLWIEDIQ